MKLAIVLIQLLKLFGILATTILGVSFTRGQRKAFPSLKKVDGKQLHLLMFSVFCFITAYGLNAITDYLKLEHDKKNVSAIYDKLQKISDVEFSIPISNIQSNVELNQKKYDYVLSVALNAESYYLKKDYSQALNIFKQLDKIVTLASIKARIADCSYYLEDYTTAIIFEKQAIQLHPNWSGPYYMLGHSYYKLGHIEEGNKALKKACSLGFDTSCENLQVMIKKYAERK